MDLDLITRIKNGFPGITNVIAMNKRNEKQRMNLVPEILRPCFSARFLLGFG